MKVSDSRVPRGRAKRVEVCIAVLLLACATSATRNPDQLNPYSGGAAAAEGKKLYRKFSCYACHGQGGGGGRLSYTGRTAGSGHRGAGDRPGGLPTLVPVNHRQPGRMRDFGSALHADGNDLRLGLGLVAHGRDDPPEEALAASVVTDDDHQAIKQ